MSKTKELETFIHELERSVGRYHKESVSADEILELAKAVLKAIEED